MFRKSFFVLIAALVLTLAACSSGPALSQSDNGGQVQVKVGGQIVIKLPGNPSTGYSWEAQNLDASMFEQVGQPTFQVSGPAMPGAGGTVTLTFKALQAGTASLTLVYHRSWETTVAPADTFSVTVTVK